MLSPLKDLYSDKNSMPILSYPQDLGSSRKGHYIAFTISTPTKSMFTGNKTSVSPTAASVGGPISNAVKSAETAMNNVSSAVGTVTSTVGAVADTVNSTLSTFNTVVGSAASVAGAVGGVTQIASSAINSGSITGGIAAGMTAVSAAGNILGSASGLANQADAVVGSVGNFLSDPMGAISGAYDSLKNALSSPDKLISKAFKGAKNNPTIAPATLKPVGYINLYTPDTVQIDQKASYSTMDTTHVFGTAGLGEEAGSKVSTYQEAFNNGGIGSVMTKGATDPLAQELLGKTLSNTPVFNGGMDQYLLAKGGSAINPQLEVVFTKMEFRTFQFAFTFTPRSKSEADAVKKIIQQFRFHAAPEIDRNGSGRYFVVPSVFNIEYMFENGPNKNLHKFAPCVLTGIVVDYAGDVGWVTHDDGMPVKTSLILKFQETEILTKESIMSKGY